MQPVLQLLLPGSRSLRLPHQLRRRLLHLLLRGQHKDLQVHGVLSLQGPELLPQIGMLQEHLLLPESLLLLLEQLLYLRSVR